MIIDSTYRWPILVGIWTLIRRDNKKRRLLVRQHRETADHSNCATSLVAETIVSALSGGIKLAAALTATCPGSENQDRLGGGRFLLPSAQQRFVDLA